jgi:hypothetical protein
MYPYWCVEKGYARTAGARDGSPEWNNCAPPGDDRPVGSNWHHRVDGGLFCVGGFEKVDD